MGSSAVLVPAAPLPCPSAYKPRPDEPLEFITLGELPGDAAADLSDNRESWIVYGKVLRSYLDACK
jgi:hypothetical protein